MLPRIKAANVRFRQHDASLYDPATKSLTQIVYGPFQYDLVLLAGIIFKQRELLVIAAGGDQVCDVDSKATDFPAGTDRLIEELQSCPADGTGYGGWFL